MAEATGISWTDSTFNPWIGCTKVGPGCDHCYAEALDKRHRWSGATHWGSGTPRMRTSQHNWDNVRRWNEKAWRAGVYRKVFCASLADVYDNEVPVEWRADLFELIEETKNLIWLILTKRIGNVARLTPFFLPENVWLGATIVNQEEAERDMPKLLETEATVKFVSYEPALGPVDWRPYRGLDWLIIGGESRQQGSKARPFDLEWARSSIAQAREIGAKPFVKQIGSGFGLRNRAGADPDEWPLDLRVQEFP